MVELRRRSFLAGLAAALATPAIVRASVIMPVRTPLLLRPVHTVSRGFPLAPGVPGSTWEVASESGHRISLICGPDGMWEPTVVPDALPAPFSADQAVWGTDATVEVPVPIAGRPTWALQRRPDDDPGYLAGPSAFKPGPDFAAIDAKYQARRRDAAALEAARRGARITDLERRFNQSLRS